MFRNYLKTAWRNLAKSKGYSIINIGGLSIGMAAAILIGLWIYDELSFNKYHTGHKTIGRIMRQGTVNNETFTATYLPYALGDELKTKYGNYFSEVMMAWAVNENILTAGEKKLSKKGEFIDASAPDVFTLKMLKGNRNGLKDPHSIFLSESGAKALFGTADPMGQLVQINSKMNVKVTGVYEDLPRNTHFYDVDFFAPWDLYVSYNDWMKSQGFDNNFLDIYVQIRDGASFEKASGAIKNIILDHVKDDKNEIAANPQLLIHPMDKWHLYSEWKNGVNAGGPIQFVWLFSIIGCFILVLACINFMNLSTARSEKRAKEVGIRKTVGSMRHQLISQFFTESVLVAFCAFVLGILIVIVSLKWFNQLASKDMIIPWGHPVFWLASLAFIIITGLLAGSYPALYLSSFRPIKVLKGVFRTGHFAAIPRKVLVVIQFSVSVILITGTVIVYKQIQYARNRPVGYDREGLLQVKMLSDEFQQRYETLRTELLNTGAVTETARSTGPVTGIWSSNGGFDWKGKDPSLQTDFGTLTVSHEYGKTVGWQFTEGRDFSRDFATDSMGIIINEAAAKYMGLKFPVGETVKWERAPGANFTILGVVKDMVMESPYEPTVPTIFFIAGYYFNWINVKIDPRVTVAAALPKIESVFKKIIPSAPFDYKFADQEYQQKFITEIRVGKLAFVFAVLAIFISCLGLFGLASFIAEKRTKEIGVRKVLGASLFNLWKMLSKDFVLLVALACLVAIPIAWYYMNEWLQKFDYRTTISWWIFGIAVAGALLITLLTVSFQAIRAGMANPVKSLRTE